MLSAFTLSLGQLGDPRILRVLGKVLLLSALVFAGIGVAGWWGIAALFARYGWSESAIAAIAGVVLAIAAGWLLWRAVAIAILNLFAEEVVDAVEARHYPAQRAMARPPGVATSIALSLRSLWRLVWVNLLALPIYVVLLFAGGVGLPVALLLVNGWLLGRDLSDMVAVRHRVGDAGRWGLSRATRLLLGVAVMMLLAIPFVNLVAPILGAAMATHLVHRRAGAVA